VRVDFEDLVDVGVSIGSRNNPVERGKGKAVNHTQKDEAIAIRCVKLQ